MTTKLRYLYRAYRYRCRVDRAELRFLCSHLHCGQVAVDIGCHKGAYTYWMRRRVGPGGLVFAFEPQPRQVAYLRDVFAAMRYENVALVPAAVSDACGRRPLYVPSGAGQTHAASLEATVGPPSRGGQELDGETRRGGEGETRNDACRSGSPPLPFSPSPPLAGAARLATPTSSLLVDVTTLDTFFAKRPRGPDFMKIDVEGHELAVLEGGRCTLQTHRPTLLVECEVRHRPDGDVRPVFALLESLGYQGSFFAKGRRPLAEFDPAVHQRLEADSVALPRGYVNNFVFEWRGASRRANDAA